MNSSDTLPDLGLTKRLERLALIIIVALTIISFFGIWDLKFTNWDDPVFITSNDLIKEINLLKIFTTPDNDHYQPLTTLSRAIEYQIAGNDPMIYHVDNLLLHLINIVLIFILLKGLIKNQFITLFTTLIFAIHPMHVEPVAWVSSRGYLLSSVFLLSAWILYISPNKPRFRQFWVILIFILALLSSRLSVILPLFLLATDHFLLNRIKWLRLLPYFVLSTAIGLLAIHFAPVSHPDAIKISMGQGFGYSIYSLGFYIVKYFIPSNLG